MTTSQNMLGKPEIPSSWKSNTCTVDDISRCLWGFWHYDSRVVFWGLNPHINWPTLTKLRVGLGGEFPGLYTLRLISWQISNDVSIFRGRPLVKRGALTRYRLKAAETGKMLLGENGRSQTYLHKWKMQWYTTNANKHEKPDSNKVK